MIVSALLTAVGLNLLFTLLLFALYSILRKQPGNLSIYAPRLLAAARQAADGATLARSGFNIDNLLPSVGWVPAAWRLSEEDLLASSGLDGLVFIRIFVFWLVTSRFWSAAFTNFAFTPLVYCQYCMRFSNCRIVFCSIICCLVA